MADIMELFRKIETAPSPSPVPVTSLIAGLGNPGAEYEGTRHNAGFQALDALATAFGARIDRLKFHALTGEATVGGTRVLLMKPQTYMNASGDAVAEAAQFYRIAPENILVLCDDISFPVGRMRIRRRGSHGGHNGLRSIVARLASEEFPRIRLGVGQKPHPDYDLADWVLGKFPPTENALLDEQHTAIAEAVRLILEGRIEDAMCRYTN